MSGTFITTGTRGQTHTVPEVASDTFALIGATQTLVGKTLTSPTINTPTITSPAITGLATVTSTFAAGVSGATGRAITGLATLPAWTSGTAMGVAGRITCGGTVSAGSYIYGTQGKVTIGAFATSGIVAGLYGQLDVTGSTISAGNIAPIQSNLYGYTTGTSTILTGLYVEHAGGGVINSLARFFGKSTYVFDIETNVHNQVSTTGTAAATTSKGWLKILVDGVARYIPLTDSVS
jgi:hypothetical protein